uniref:SKP1 component POZ domain-containing protein n=1 Tax=Peromyscus maniculatus bairdii TaxID=230844 RepID=A0A8C8TLD7_PERMB
MNVEEKTHGNCEGPDAMHVKLLSSDGRELILKREPIQTSGAIKAMSSGPAWSTERVPRLHVQGCIEKPCLGRGG